MYKSFYIITELCEIYQSNIKNYIDKDKLNHILEIFKTNNDPKYENFISWAEEIIFSVLYN